MLEFYILTYDMSVPLMWSRKGKKKKGVAFSGPCFSGDDIAVLEGTGARHFLPETDGTKDTGWQVLCLIKVVNVIESPINDGAWSKYCRLTILSQRFSSTAPQKPQTVMTHEFVVGSSRTYLDHARVSK